MKLLDNFVLKDGKIHLNKYEFVIRHYKTTAKEEYIDRYYYVDEAGAEELETQRIPKHQLLKLISKTELNNEQYAYMEGIALKTQDFNKEMAEIASYGSLEAYQASLQETRDEYLLDLEYRISAMELGLNE